MAYESEVCQMSIVAQRLHGGVCTFLKDDGKPTPRSETQATLDRLSSERLNMLRLKRTMEPKEYERKCDELGRKIYETTEKLKKERAK